MLVALLAGTGGFLTARPLPGNSPLLGRYPELRYADAGLVKSVSKALDDPHDQVFRTGDMDFARHEPKPLQIRPDRVLSRLRKEGRRGAIALLRAWLERSGSGGMFFYPNHVRDDLTFPFAWWLTEIDDPTVAAVLRRMIADEELGDPLRLRAVVASCRPEHDVAVDVLVDTVLSPRTAQLLAERILWRIHRLEAPLPERFADLLYLPYFSHDILAAGVLARRGDLRAPSLIVDGLEYAHSMSRERTRLMARAILSVAGDDPAIAELVPRVIETAGDRRQTKTKQLTEAFQAWLDARPGLRNTPFEVARREYRTRIRKERDLAHSTWEEIRDAPEPDLDFGAALLHLTEVRWHEERVDATERLEDLDRLCRGVARDLEGKSGPDEVIPVLHRWLRPDRCRLGGWAEDGATRFLPVVLDGYYANCAGLTALYIAVADRLELPIHAVSAPEHLFVRWDDGKTRRNLELTEGGEVRPDAHYVGTRIDPASVKQGVYLRNLTRRETLGQLLYNNAAYLEGLGESELAATLLARSLELAPRSPLALHADVSRRWTERIGDHTKLAKRLLADIERALRLDPGYVPLYLLKATIHDSSARPKDALAARSEALKRDPDHIGALRAMADSLVVAGRAEEALTLLAEALRRTGDETLELTRFQVLVVTDDPSWRIRLGEWMAANPWRPNHHLAAAAVLLNPGAAGQTRVAEALGVLDEVKYLEDETFQTREGHEPPPIQLRERLLAARAPYFRLRARAAELRADLKAAGEWHEKAAEAEKLARSGSFTWMRWSSDD